MKLSLEAKQISTEFWLVTLYLSEHGKMDNVRDFIVTEQQLAFLNLIEKNFAGNGENK